MGFFRWLFRRKKKKEEERDLELKEEPASSNYPIQAYPQGQVPSRVQQPVMPTPVESDDREFQVLSSKLDVLNAKLDAINQRLTNLEKLAERPEQKW